MYGDCQVLSSIMGNGAGSVISPDSLFSSPIRNPGGSGGDATGLNFGGFMGGMPFHAFSSIIPKEEAMMIGMGRKDDEMDQSGGSGSGGYLDGGALSCGEELDAEAQQLPTEPAAKKKRYHRHTARQIQEMEALFKECPHPDDKQRMKLSQDLGLKPRQVKFWFQNRRTQMKAQQDRSDNVILRAENESLKNDNYRLQAAIRNVVCPNCGGPAILGEMSFDEQNLRVENTRLKEELERLSCITTRYGGLLGKSAPPPPLMLPSLDLDMGIYSRHFHESSVAAMSGCGADMMPGIPDVELSPFACGLIMEQDKAVALDLAMTAADHLGRMCRSGEPLWVRRSNDNVVCEVMNLDEHRRLLPWPVDIKCSGEFRTEASRDNAMVIMNSITLVDAFMDANKWMHLFPSVVSKAKTIQILSPGITGHGSGALHLMRAEIQVLSPLVPTREAYFLRYCQQNVEERAWTVVDFPIDGFHDVSHVSLQRYRRRVSGCLIQDMPNGYSRVVWVEHAEVEDKPVHKVMEKYVNSGTAFGASRWLSVLQRQCERLASLMARNISDLGVIPTTEARKNIMELSQRMIRMFCADISSSGSPSWTALADASGDTIRIATRKNTEPGQPNGVILTAVSTTWLPFSHQQVFDLLTDEQRRSQLDVLSSGNSLHEVAHIANGSHPRNCISLLRMNSASNSSQNVELLLQESSTHVTGGSTVIYTTIDVDAVQVAMSGEDPSYIPLLPMGFIMLPAASPPSFTADGSSLAESGNHISGGITGCLLTVALQVLTSAVPSAKLNVSSVTAINGHLSNTVHQISTALCGGVPDKPETALPAPEQ